MDNIFYLKINSSTFLIPKEHIEMAERSQPINMNSSVSPKKKTSHKLSHVFCEFSKKKEFASVLKASVP